MCTIEPFGCVAQNSLKKLFPYVLATARVLAREQSPVVAEVRLIFCNENISLLKNGCMPWGKEESHFKMRRNMKKFWTKVAGEGNSNCLFSIWSSQAVLTRAAGKVDAEDSSSSHVGSRFAQYIWCVVLNCDRRPCHRRSVAVAGPAEVRQWLRLAGGLLEVILSKPAVWAGGQLLGSLQHSPHSGGCRDCLPLVAAELFFLPPLISTTGREGGITTVASAFCLACLVTCCWRRAL